VIISLENDSKLNGFPKVYVEVYTIYWGN